MSHILLVLPNPDWIQLSNIARKFVKHPGAEAYTLKTISGKLKTLPTGSKIHIIGHGDRKKTQHASHQQLGIAIAGSGIPSNIEFTIRLDTCSSAAAGDGDNLTQMLGQYLRTNPPKYTKVRTEGTVGASITGFKEGREVVDPTSIEDAKEIQKELLVKHSDDLGEAGRLSEAWNESFASTQIKALAESVQKHTDPFFVEFRERMVAADALLDKGTVTYKMKYPPVKQKDEGCTIL